MNAPFGCVFIACLLLVGCEDHRSPAERLLAEKEACSKLGAKWAYDGYRWKCMGLAGNTK